MHGRKDFCLRPQVVHRSFNRSFNIGRQTFRADDREIVVTFFLTSLSADSNVIRFSYTGRAPEAAVAAGSKSQHVKQQRKLLDDAFRKL